MIYCQIAMKFRILALILLSLYMAAGCVDKPEIENKPGEVDTDKRLEELQKEMECANANTTVAYDRLYGEDVIVGLTASNAPDGTVIGYRLEYSDGESYDVRFGDKYSTAAPLIGEDKDGYWSLSYDKGNTWTRLEGNVKVGPRPALIGMDKEHFWTVSTGGKYKRLTDASGLALNALECKAVSGNTIFSSVSYDEDAHKLAFYMVTGKTETVSVYDNFGLKVDIEDEPSIRLGETRKFPVGKKMVKEIECSFPSGWAADVYDDASGSWLEVTAPQDGLPGQYEVTIIYKSEEGYTKKVVISFELLMVKDDFEGCEEWNDFEREKGEGLLLDFSYAGYNHGETAPPDAYSLGYKVYDITDYGAVPNDGKSDREAFLKVLEKVMGAPAVSNTSIAFPSRPSAKAVIYFPEGEFILHTSEDDVTDASGKVYSQGIVIRAGDFIIKGAGRDKTTIVMQDPNQPTDPKVMYSSPDMILLTHWTAFASQAHWPVTGDSGRGTFSVTLDGHGLSAGDWVCLHVKSTDTELLREELYPHYTEAVSYSGGNWSIFKDGVTVNDYHQVRSVDGDVVTFHEPIMHEVKAKYGWEVYKYPNYANVGVEDITFKGNAKDDFVHHGSWEDDGAYKPISMNRLTNSWLRRCRFTSTSEACSVSGSANVSVYDVEFTGKRGHSAIRSAGSSRVFIGATVDKTSGNLIGNKKYEENTGNYHAVGVSKPSMGAVLWRNTWGNDSCFESHATQPRATLIDRCSGGFMRYRMGGDANELPNHLADLTLWNFNATSGNRGGQDGNDYSNWLWWGSQGRAYWTTLPPVIVGFHGAISVAFTTDKGDSKHVGSNGTPVQPESLYEAQLQARLGYVPAWLNALK